MIDLMKFSLTEFCKNSILNLAASQKLDAKINDQEESKNGKWITHN